MIDAAGARFAEHNAIAVCPCSTCNIVRMCDRMGELAKRTMERVDQLTSK